MEEVAKLNHLGFNEDVRLISIGTPDDYLDYI